MFRICFCYISKPITVAVLLLLPLLHIQSEGDITYNITIDEYISQYKNIAMSEMQRTGVPASIKLAQGILESSFGNSYLAREGKNHFGIKCQRNWQGRRIYKDDDKANECFRKYYDPYESYIDHSNFIRNNVRYSSLFNLDVRDYEGWAKGLSAAGYATNPKYAKLLIDLIEKHELHQFDYDNNRCSLVTTETKDFTPEIIPRIMYQNRIKTIIFSCEVTPQQVVEIYPNIRYSRLMKYNDFEQTASIPANTNIFLQPKRKRAAIGIPIHIVSKGETMRELSQLYGVRLDRLYKYNMMRPGQEPAENEVVRLRKKRKKPIKLARQSNIKNNTNGNSGPQVRPYTPPNKNSGTINNSNTTKPPATNNTITQNYTVRSGDTLYRIARKFNTSVEAIKSQNNLSNTNIRPGDVLKITTVR